MIFLFFVLACTSDKADSIFDTATDTSIDTSETNDTATDDTNDSSVDSVEDTAEDTLTVTMSPIWTTGAFYGTAALDTLEQWIACDPLVAVAKGTCYLIDSNVQDVQDDNLSAYIGGLSFLGVGASNIDGNICTSDYSSDANGRHLCFTPVSGEKVSVDDVLISEVSGDEAAYYGTSSTMIYDGSVWVAQTGDGINSTSIKIYEETDGFRTLIAEDVCNGAVSYGAMEILPFGEGIIAACDGLGGAYVTRAGVEWYWDTRSQIVSNPEDTPEVDFDDAAGDHAVLSPWLASNGEGAVIIGNLLGTYSGYVFPDGTYYQVSGYTYAQVDTSNGLVGLAYSIAYASDGVSIGTLWANYLKDSNEDAQIFDLPLEKPYTELWRLVTNGQYVLATGINSPDGAILKIE